MAQKFCGRGSSDKETRESLEERALRELRVELVDRLDPEDNILNFLKRRNGLTGQKCKQIRALEIAPEKNRALLKAVRQKRIIPLFLEALEYKRSHVYLATLLRDKIDTLKQSAWNSRIQGPNLLLPHKVNIMDKKKKLLATISYKLRVITNSGKQELPKFISIVQKMKHKFPNDCDVLFQMLESELAKRRLFYDKGQDQMDIIADMERLVATMTHSEAGSMVFLARKGSAIAMKGNLSDVEEGIRLVEDSRKKMQLIQPCKDTGMVMYIHVNLLMQLYEARPTEDNKLKLKESILEAIEVHFPETSADMRDEFCRIFYLKLAFCCLGIGVFGRRTNYDVQESDIKEAEACFKKAGPDRKDYNNRRYMFYCLGNAVLYYHKERICPTSKPGEFASQGLTFARDAKYLSETYGFKEELEPIEDIIHCIMSMSPPDRGLEDILLQMSELPLSTDKMLGSYSWDKKAHITPLSVHEVSTDKEEVPKEEQDEPMDIEEP